MDDENLEIISSYTSEFEKILYQYGIKNEDEEWEKAFAYVEENKKNIIDGQFNEAKEFYDKALKFWRLDKFEIALEFVNDAISMAPYDICDFRMLRHLILRNSGKYLESFDDLIKYLDGLVIGQGDKIEDFKDIYEQYINTIKSAKYSFELIPVLNEKTQNNMASFTTWGIKPHIFTFEELDPLPF